MSIPTRNKLCRYIGAFALVTSTLFAQTATNAGSGDIADQEDIIALSPFTVNAEDDQGYRATSTLSGTRLKTDLTDVGASISVMTSELLADIGATDITDALLYSVNTENENEFAEDDSEGISITTTNSNRVRGIASSTYARGFFDTNVRGDSYNVERFTMANGPNSILYGLGSPAGIVNSTIKRASAQKNFGEFSFKFDTNDGHRKSVDYNQFVLDDRVGIRVAAMEQKKRSWKQPDSDDENRIFLTATVKPFKNGVMRYSYERMKNERIKSRSFLPLQSVQTWLDNGKPLYDHLNDRITWDNGSTWQDAPILGNGNIDDDALYALGIDYGAGGPSRVKIQGGIEPGSWDAIADGDQRALFEQLGIAGLRWNNTAIATGRTSPQLPDHTLSNDNLLPYDYALSGLSNFADIDSETHTFTWEQKLADGLYVEFGYNDEQWNRNSFDPLRSTGLDLKADVNFYLPLVNFPNADIGSTFEPDRTNDAQVLDANGNPALIPNPNAGRFFVEGQGIGYKQRYNFETYRATASYELNLTDRNEWLGRHSVALLYQHDEKEELYMKTRHFNASASAIGRFAQGGENNVLNRYYIDPPTSGSNGANGLPYPDRFSTADYPSWKSIHYGLGGGGGEPAHSVREIEGKMVVLQNRLLKNRLITTFGFREDSETIYQSFNPNGTPAENRPFLPVPSTPSFPKTSGNTKTIGAVFKATDWLKVFYNKSDSFLPQSHLHDYYNNPLAPADGEGQDIGVMLDLMEGKLFARVSWFEQSANGALEIDWVYERMKWRIVNTMETAIERWAAVLPERPQWAADRNLSVDDAFRPLINDNLRSVRDFESEGIEIELAARPFKGLDLRLTLGKNEATNTRTLPNLQTYVEDRLPTWKKYELLALRPDLRSRVRDPADPSRDRSYGSTRGQLLSNRNVIGNRMFVGSDSLARLSFAREEEGSASARARKYRANFIANYNFTEGKMKGFGIGSGIRYRSKAAIGYLGKPNPFMTELLAQEPDLAGRVDPLSFLTADITKPIYGKSQLDIDAWIKYTTSFNLGGRDYKWRAQINITNLFDDQDLIARTATPDGAISRWMGRAPRTVSLTNTISF
jgi:iron complex outermembrane recepter protein